MSLVKVADAGGNTVTLAEHPDGYRTATFNHPPEVTVARILALKDLTCRPDDIWLITPLKSGTHWLWEIISMLMQGRAETVTTSKVVLLPEATPLDVIDKCPSPRVFNTHLSFRFLPRQMTERRCKVVFCARNPKDVAVSLYHHTKGIKLYEYDGEWQDFFPLFLNGDLDYGSWFDFIFEWEDFVSGHPDQPTHLVYYEDIKENSLREISKLARFLGVDDKDGLCERVSEKCTFEKMRVDKHGTGKFTREGFSVYRKGIIGDWQNWFTVAQDEMFDKIFARTMANSKLHFRVLPTRS